VLWSPDNKVMPPAHGHRLAALLPWATYAEIPGAFVLSMLDEPRAVAEHLSRFLLDDPEQAARGPRAGVG
jgi:pimeloyl-ACP methyl ester carboxylesterase